MFGFFIVKLEWQSCGKSVKYTTLLWFGHRVRRKDYHRPTATQTTGWMPVQEDKMNRAAW